jgi:hypothetical protein
MTKIIVLIAALVAASPMPSFAQTAEPPADKTGIVDTLLEQADATRCAVARDDIPDDVLLSSCNQHASGGVIDELLKNADGMRCQIGREINEMALSTAGMSRGASRGTG